MKTTFALAALSALSACFASPLQAQLQGPCYSTFSQAVSRVEAATPGSEVTVLSCLKVGRGYDLFYQRECPDGGTAYTSLVIDPHGGDYNSGRCIPDGEICGFIGHSFASSYRSREEFFGDKGDVAELCEMLPLDEPVCDSRTASGSQGACESTAALHPAADRVVNQRR